MKKYRLAARGLEARGALVKRESSLVNSEEQARAASAYWRPDPTIDDCRWTIPAKWHTACFLNFRTPPPISRHP
jgi:hypothetical protein